MRLRIRWWHTWHIETGNLTGLLKNCLTNIEKLNVKITIYRKVKMSSVNFLANYSPRSELQEEVACVLKLIRGCLLLSKRIKEIVSWRKGEYQNWIVYVLVFHVSTIVPVFLLFKSQNSASKFTLLKW